MRIQKIASMAGVVGYLDDSLGIDFSGPLQRLLILFKLRLMLHSEESGGLCDER